MRLLPISLLVITTAFLFGSVPAAAQDRTVLGALFGSSANSSSASSRSVSVGKRVEIDLTKQRLYAYNGNRLFMKTRISSGRTGNTPTGRFRAGPYKSATHFSSLYHNAPMPWSVQVTGHIFIHGFSEVPNYPASKGCIRVPISGMNPARKLFRWLDVGTPIRIYRS